MSAVVDLASWAALLAGSAFCIVGGLGLHRLPDFYSRTHASSITDTLGAWLMILGLALQAGFSLVAVKLLIILTILFFTSPTAAHALVKAAYARGLKAYPGDARSD